MNYYKDTESNVYAYDNEQVAIGYPIEPMTPMSAEEVEAHINPPKTEEELVAEAREAFKAQRELAVAAIKVTSTLGRTFDGGEVDTQRMLEPISVLKEKPEGTTWLWVLADNTAVEVALPEFLEVLELAGREKTRLWVQP